MSKLAEPPSPTLLHYRPWQSAHAGDPLAHRELKTVLFLGVQALLFTILFLPDAWPSVRFLATLAFLLLWGLVVRTRAWPIARSSLVMLFRRKLFWAVYGLAVLVFLLFFFGQYLMAWAADQVGETEVRVTAGVRANPQFLVQLFREALKLDGSKPEMYRNFFWFEGYCIMVVLALAGAILLGNDLRFGSLPFYLARPISRWDYLLGKGIAVAIVVNLITTVPALALFAEHCVLDSWEQMFEGLPLVAGILAYGLILSASMTCLLLATATWLQKTVPLIMAWTTVLFFCRQLANSLVDRMGFDPRWRLIDLWNSTYLLGNLVLGVPTDKIQPALQPAWFEAALVLGGVSVLCLSYLILRIRGVEIVK